MKKLLFCVSVILASVCAQAQLRVNENGDVSIQTTDSVVSPLAVGYAGNSTYSIAATGVKDGIFGRRYGTPTNTTDSWTGGIVGVNSPNSDRFYIGTKGQARRTTASTSGRSYGIYGDAGNCTSGYNYGVFGVIYGSNYGAAVFGTVNPYNAYVPGLYAGYFAGDIKATGNIYGTVLTASASSNSSAVAQTLNISDESTTETVSAKLAQLSPIQYMLETPVAPASTDSDTMVTVALCEAEVQALEKTHYGIDATALQAVFPDLVYEDQHGELCINYIEMVPLLVQSIKELQSEITALKSGNVSLMGNNGTVYARSLGNNATPVEDATSVTIPTLAQNDPNPFTENTTIAYSLPESVQHATIYIYDMNGTQIHQIPLSERGNAVVTVSGGELKAGMYLYSLIADGKVIDTKRMILTK